MLHGMLLRTPIVLGFRSALPSSREEPVLAPSAGIMFAASS